MPGSCSRGRWAGRSAGSARRRAGRRGGSRSGPRGRAGWSPRRRYRRPLTRPTRAAMAQTRHRPPSGAGAGNESLRGARPGLSEHSAAALSGSGRAAGVLGVAVPTSSIVSPTIRPRPAPVKGRVSRSGTRSRSGAGRTTPRRAAATVITADCSWPCHGTGSVSTDPLTTPEPPNRSASVSRISSHAPGRGEPDAVAVAGRRA